MNTNLFLEKPYNLFPDRIALSAEDAQITYAQLYNQANRLTDSLRKMGCTKGCRIGFLDRNCSEAVTIYYAASRLCAVFVPLDYNADLDTLCNMIGTVQLDMLFCGEGHIGFANRLRKSSPSLKKIISMSRKITGLYDYNDLLASGNSEFYMEPTEGSELNVILFTSGISGEPKAVALAHNNFIRLVYHLHSCLEAYFNGPVLLCVSIHYIIGMVAMMSPFLTGRRLVMMRYFLPDDWMILVNAEKIGLCSRADFSPP